MIQSIVPSTLKEVMVQLFLKRPESRDDKRTLISSSLTFIFGKNIVNTVVGSIRN